MKLQNTFEVPAPPDRVWATLLDVERVATCMPGAEITEVDGDEWRGRVKVKFGPVGLSFAGTITVQQRDDDARSLVLHGKGMEQRGKGSASAVICTTVIHVDGGSLVSVQSDVTLTGTVVQVSRGMLPDINERMMEEFAGSLRELMASEDESGQVPEQGTSAPPSPASFVPTTKSLPGFRMGLWAFWRMVRRTVRNVFTRRRSA